MRRRRLGALVVAVIAGASLPALVAAPAAAAAFPPGFTDTLVAGGLGSPTAVARLPDGRFLVTSQEGKLRLVTESTSTVALDLAALSAVCAGGEMGLLGVAVHPQFADNGFVYLFYTARVGSCALNGANPGGAKNRVSRFTLSGGVVNPASEVKLLDNMPEWGGNHNGGEVHVANDGLLYVGVGDGGGGRPQSAPSDLSLPNGKILRINLDGTIPAGNPHGTTVCKDTWGPPGAAKVCGEIWADGLRNPFRLGFDASAPGAKFRVNDVGAGVWEEVSEGIAGAHYGWPCREGPAAFSASAVCSEPFEEPVLWYAHVFGCNVITGGAFVPPGMWEGYDGAYLYVDFGCGLLFVAQPGEMGLPPAVLATGMELTSDLDFFSIDGTYTLLYTTYAAGGQLRRVGGPSPAAPPATIPGTKFTPTAPTRVLDTRDGTGVGAAKLGPGAAISVDVTGGPVPDTAKAVAVNLTATAADGSGFVTAWPAGQARPPTSSLNLSFPGETAANAAVVPVGVGGHLNLFTQNGAHLVADVTGYFTDAGATTDGRFQPAATPTRVLDTRFGTGGKLGPFLGNGQFDLQVAGAAGVPADATAVALTVTYTDDPFPGFVTLWPTGTARPLASTTNPNGGGDIRSNLAFVGVGSGGGNAGKVSIYSLTTTHIVVDVAGWFVARTGTHGQFTAVTPQRVADSRQPGAPFPRIGGGATATMDFTAFAPGAPGAVLANLTATNTVAGGFLTAFPFDTLRPNASSVNWSGASQHRAALTISSLASANRVSFFAFTGTDAVIDVSGWFEQ